jgi:predicted metalloendopeptidase
MGENEHLSIIIDDKCEHKKVSDHKVNEQTDVESCNARPNQFIFLHSWFMNPATVNAWYSPNHNSISKLMKTINFWFFPSFSWFRNPATVNAWYSPNHNSISK